MKKKSAIKIIAIDIAISFFFASIFVLCLYLFGDNKITYYTNLINKVSIKVLNKEKTTYYDLTTKRITHYPEYGKKYASLEIPSISLELPVYHGDDLKILRYGVGHYAGSYFPGEGGTIIFAAHNTVGFFNKLDYVKAGDIITIKANYGTFTYQVDNFKIINEKDLDAFPIQTEKEMLILYTCYPIHRSVIGRRTERFVVYAYRVESAS